MKRFNILSWFLYVSLGIAFCSAEAERPVVHHAHRTAHIASNAVHKAFTADEDTAALLQEALEDFFIEYTQKDFRPQLSVRLDHFDVDDENRTLDVYGNEGFASQLFTPQIVTGIYRNLKDRLPEPYNDYRLTIYGFGREISYLIPNIYHNRKDSARLWNDIDYTGAPWVRNASRPYSITRGLENRHITLWASHGRYYNHTLGCWKWQRPLLYCTAEDLFTESFVTPFLIPMLQNAGAVVYTPRERDRQTEEIIVDNDGSRTGEYLEKVGREIWQNTAEPGYAARKEIYSSGENPFTDGTARTCATTRQAEKASLCRWMPKIERAGRYAVYVSYQTLKNSIPDAHYTVRHGGVETRFVVNQTMGSGTWVYLGTFYFGHGMSEDNCVTLSNVSRTHGMVTADAVRFGGGMGNVIRGTSDDDAETSGLPRFLEGARYSTQIAGMPDSIYDTKDGRNDYADDINARSRSLNFLGGGSAYLPDSMGRGVPFELSLAVHSDAGRTTDGTLIGTLGISTQLGNSGDTTFLSGVSRMASADLSATIQSSVYGDMKRNLGRWTRRELYNRNYSETRIPEVPSAIVEMLSHQNFADMKYGHDPVFKFLMSRAIYKGVLRFMAEAHGTPYIVQPLPVRGFSAQLTPEGNVTLRWTARTDSIETTARPDAYVVYCRRDSGDFDNGTVVQKPTFTMPVDENVIYSFKVTAVNEGGESFPSEELSVMRATGARGEVMIVNGFDRLSAPAVVETPDSAGFLLDRDMGVAYGETAEYSGKQTCFDNPSSGAATGSSPGRSGDELAGQIVGGNTFNYPYTHGTAIRSAGKYSFSSCSAEAVTSGSVSLDTYKIVDLILGLQKDDGASSILKYKTYTPQMQNALKSYLEGGGRLFVSGAYLAADNQSPDDRRFTTHVLHYGSDMQATETTDNTVTGATLNLTYTRDIRPDRYAVLHPDHPAPTQDAYTAFVYSDRSSAGTAYDGRDCKILTLGFPFESITTEPERNNTMQVVLQFLGQ